MCGILGILNLEDRGPIPLDTLVQAGSLLNHRGPDESGVYIDDNIGLYHARLSIVDLTTGTQPIHNEDRTKWIVLNGEIFNYPELKKDLEQKGHRFYTTTDTEVLIHLYEEKGVEMLHDLNGQFAFAIWDSNSRELFMARDRVGIVPMHYAVRDGRLFFASEIKAILAASRISAEIDPIALDQIFTFWTTLPGRTAFKDVDQLPPGYYLTVSKGRINTRKYWDYSFEASDDRPVESIMDELHELVQDALRIRLRADVPVGSYLSGGFDSSLLTSLIKKNFNNGLRTFGIGFEDPDYDESDYQQEMVDFLDVDHTQIKIKDSDIEKSFARALWHCETPLLRTAPVPLLHLSERVRDSGFKVVVTGEGADEIFGGYNIFLETKARAFWARQPESKLRPLLIGKLYPYIFKDNQLENVLRAFFSVGLTDVSDPFYSHRIRWNNTARIKNFFSPETRNTLNGYNSIEELESTLPVEYVHWDLLAKAQYIEMKLFMGNYLLSSQGDRVAMANSVEMRPVYLDHRIVEVMGRVPAVNKIRAMREKFLLKNTFNDLLPDSISGRVKQPYRAPVGKAILNLNGKMPGHEIASSSLDTYGIFDMDKVELLVRKLAKSEKTSELDGMALSGIRSTRTVQGQFDELPLPSGEGSPELALLIDNRSG